jgi:hypothetical protein
MKTQRADKGRLENRWGGSVSHALFNFNPPFYLHAHPRPSDASAEKVFKVF